MTQLKVFRVKESQAMSLFFRLKSLASKAKLLPWREKTLTQIMALMTKRNMPRKPGGKPGKPSKPGKPGKPFERPEGENWVRTQII